MVAEYVGSEDVDDTHDEGDDAGGNNGTPHGFPKRFFRGGFLVQITEGKAAEDEHGDTKSEKAGRRGEEWPVAGDVASKKGCFGNDEEDWGKLAS